MCMIPGPSREIESNWGGSRDFKEGTICRGVGGIKETPKMGGGAPGH